MRPDVTLVIPSRGRDTLPRCLDSLRPEHHGGYQAEILVIADTASPLLCDVQAIAKEYGVEYIEHDALTHNWGYPQLARGYGMASGGMIGNIGDDDIYVPGAFPTILRAIEESPPGPLLFRAELHPSRTRGNSRPVTLWAERGELVRGRVTGQNFWCPNVPGRIGFWWDDFCQLEASIRLWDGQVTWREEIIARCY